MKIFWIILAIAIGGVLWVCVPIFQETLACYDGTTQQLDSIGFRTKSLGWDEKQVCFAHWEIIGQLDTCLKIVNKKHQFTPFVSSYIIGVISFIRPSVQSYSVFKQEHNTECQAYPAALVE